VNLESLLACLSANGLGDWAHRLQAQSRDWLVGHGDYPRWSAALASLPELDNVEARFDLPAVTIKADPVDSARLREALRGLMPWRKGPFEIADVYIDSEWRSDLKWARVAPALAPLAGRRILDIGSGNAYYGFRMLAQSPALVLGIEPSVLYNLQFQALQKYLLRPEIALLPLGVDDLPENLAWFDTVFSMGVFYHRKSPLDHLSRLFGFLRPGGELCLETLVIEGAEGRVLVPRKRYARMRNVWFIPSAAELAVWLRRCGFIDVRLVDESVTSLEEQRSTDWMQFESLAQCLDPADNSRTLEGYPAPRRAVLIAHRPAI
jgi:tRNA (mo5U34)-methyltransferase